MADIFVSYARTDKARVAPLVGALEAHGWSVWWDREITPGQEFDEQIIREIEAARAVIVVWTPASVGSRWVRGEARLAADRGTLVPVRFEAPNLPLDVRAIHTTDLDDWKENAQGIAFQELLRALGPLLKTAAPAGGAAPAHAPNIQSEAKGISVCVLPFANMSDDAQQEYFSDGISEDIITDLSKVSALAVVARNTAFTFKGKHVDVPQVAKQLKVSHVLEGSVRKSGNRVRITAQLIDGSTGNHVWAERYDRSLDDIFALQDEISQAIVATLKLKLFPEEKQAIEQRGTTNVEAYDLFLRARSLLGHFTPSSAKRGIELYRQAIALDPKFVPAYVSLMESLGQYAIISPENRAATREEMKVLGRQLLAIGPNNAALSPMRALVFLLDAKFHECEQLLDQIESSPNPQMNMPNRLRAELEDAVCHFKSVARSTKQFLRDDPLSLIRSIVAQQVFDLADLPDEAQAEYERSKDLQGNHGPAEFLALIRMWGCAGPDETRAQLQRVADGHRAAFPMPIFDQLVPVLFDPVAARALVKSACEDPSYQDPTRMMIVTLLAGLFGDTDLKLITIRRAYVELGYRPTRDMWKSIFKDARLDPRFKDILRELGLVEYWRKSGKWGDFARPLGTDDFECR